jgi:methylated-DNA-protein-cysteine methyltransferase related protein
MNPFEEAVARVIGSLKPGDLVTYGEVAAEAGYPGAARAVGTFLRTTELNLPWWRVLGSGGVLRAPDLARQAELLAKEGFRVIGGRVKI